MTNMVPGELIGNLGDTHVYKDQWKGANQQVLNNTYPLPKLYIKPGKREKITDYEIDDFVIEGYQNAGAIDYPLSN